MAEIAYAVVSFAVPVTTRLSESAESAEARPTAVIEQLDTEHRSRRPLEEPDRVSREQRARMPRLIRPRERMGVQEQLWRNRTGIGGRSL